MTHNVRPTITYNTIWDPNLDDHAWRSAGKGPQCFGARRRAKFYDQREIWEQSSVICVLENSQWNRTPPWRGGSIDRYHRQYKTEDMCIVLLPQFSMLKLDMWYATQCLVTRMCAKWYCEMTADHNLESLSRTKGNVIVPEIFFISGQHWSKSLLNAKWSQKRQECVAFGDAS